MYFLPVRLSQRFKLLGGKTCTCPTTRPYLPPSNHLLKTGLFFQASAPQWYGILQTMKNLKSTTSLRKLHLWFQWSPRLTLGNSQGFHLDGFHPSNQPFTTLHNQPWHWNFPWKTSYKGAGNLPQHPKSMKATCSHPPEVPPMIFFAHQKLSTTFLGWPNTIWWKHRWSNERQTQWMIELEETRKV